MKCKRKRTGDKQWVVVKPEHEPPLLPRFGFATLV